MIPLPRLDWHGFLARPPLPTASAESIAELRRAPILITGAAGSIGSGVALRLANAGVELILLDSSEAGLYELQNALRSGSAHRSFIYYLGSVADRELLDEIFSRYRPGIVLHTAAFKHVPLLEEQPLSAIGNNIFGTVAISDASARHGALTVLLSTDKAVAPRSVMGATKHVAENIVLSSNGLVVRLANVLGSRGSVSEVFAQQIATGQALTVTHAAAERYFLTLEEAVELLVASASSRDQSSIIAPMLTNPHRIADLASFMVNTLAPERKIPVQFTGLRVGEKLSERLWAEDESAIEDPAAGVVRITPPACSRASMRNGLHALQESLNTRDIKSALLALQKLAPGYEPSAAVLALADRAAVAHG